MNEEKRKSPLRIYSFSLQFREDYEKRNEEMSLLLYLVI